MENQIKVFRNKQFGEVRTVEENGKVYFCGKDCAEMLGYSNTKDALARHCKSDGEVKYPRVVKRDLGVNTGIRADGTPAFQTVQAVFIDEGNLYRLITHSKLPAAEAFESWVFDEVLPTIRKTGEYKAKSVYTEDERKKLADAKLLNAKARAANVWLKLSKESNVPTFKDICVAYGSAVMNDGTPILSLPAAPERTYSAKEIGEMVGMSANKVGLLTNKFALKTDTYGQWVWDKSEHSAKQVRTFRYNIRIVEALQELLDKGVA